MEPMDLSGELIKMDHVKLGYVSKMVKILSLLAIYYEVYLKKVQLSFISISGHLSLFAFMGYRTSIGRSHLELVLSITSSILLPETPLSPFCNKDPKIQSLAT